MTASAEQLESVLRSLYVPDREIREERFTEAVDYVRSLETRIDFLEEEVTKLIGQVSNVANNLTTHTEHNGEIRP